MSELTTNQRLAVESVDSNVLVSAGAGSGKTRVLVDRYIHILQQNPDLRPNNLIAVTYTKKAAAEMRSRIKQKIETLLKAESLDDSSKDRWYQLRQEIDLAPIGTIHSLCESILRANPAEAGIDPGFEILDELERAEALHASIEESLLRVSADLNEEHLLLLNYPPDTIKQLIGSLVRSPLQFDEAKQALLGLSDQDLAQHFSLLLTQLQANIIFELSQDQRWLENLEYLRESPRDPGKPSAPDKLEGYRKQIIAIAEKTLSKARGSVHSQDELAESIDDLRALLAIKVGTAGGPSEKAKEMRAKIAELKLVIKQLLSDLPSRIDDTDNAAFACIRAMANLANQTIQIYKDKKHHLQKLDFDDLIKLTYDLLSKAGSEAKSNYNNKLAAILVDEFQDTNRLLSRLILLLAGAKTRIFFIGDDKQSIYKFQGADVSTFNEWKQFLASTTSENLKTKDSLSISGPRLNISLSDSFRSHPSIVGFVNDIFARLMPLPTSLSETPPRSPWRAEYKSLSPQRTDDPDSCRTEVIIYNSPSESHTSTAFEAKAICAWILEKINSQAAVQISGQTRPIQFGDFAILVQRNKDFKPIAQALANAEIPYVAAAGSGFLDRQEIYDLENALAFLACPEDSQSLFAILRSPMFGLSDDLLHGLAQGRTQSLWKTLLQLRDNQALDLEIIENAVLVLANLLKHSGSKPLPELVAQIIHDTSFDISLLALPDGHQRARNLWRFIHLAEENSMLPIKDFLVSLEDMRALNIKVADAPLDSRQAVKLMTIHASKGLEFPAVILPVLNTSEERGNRLIFHREFGLAFDTTRNREEKPGSYRIARYLDKDMQIAEKKRLFYVAMTRARDYLAFFAASEARDYYSFRRWLWDFLQLEDYDFQSDKKIQLPSGSYLLKFIDQAKLESLSKDNHLVSNLKKQDLRPGFAELDLLEPIARPISVPKSSWQAMLRITPATSEIKIHPTVIGNFFHAIMQRLQGKLAKPSRQDLIEIASGNEIAIVENQMLELLLKDGEYLLDKFFASPLLSLMQNARTRYHETPYMVAADNRVDTRRPDLLLQDELGQWHVIDFKTDHFDLSDIDFHAHSHHSQLSQYVQDIQKIANIACKPHIYFAQHGMLYSLGT
jgi:ATP-dependent exoDNAse (exonuclease V) beta subunit